MGLQVIKDMDTKVKALEEAMATQKSDADNLIEELRGEMKDLVAERKTGFGDEKVYSDGQVAQARKKGSKLYLKSLLSGRDMASFDEYKDIENIISKALKPTDVSAWLAEEFSSDVIAELEAVLKVEALFGKVTMPANRNTFSIPGKTGDAVAYLIAPGDDAIESAIAAAKVSFTTQRIKTLIGVTDQADIESITAIVDLVKKELARSLARATENAIIMGDTTTATANSVLKAFDGVLKMAVDAGNTFDNGGGVITAANIANTRATLGIYGVMASDLAIVAPVNSAYAMLQFPEVLTIDKYGVNATILKGEIGKLWGMPIIVTDFIATNLDASGKVDTTTTPGTKTAVLIVNKNYLAVADRGSASLETERKAVSSTTLYVGFRDVDFKKLTITSTPVAALVNVQA